MLSPRQNWPTYLPVHKSNVKIHCLRYVFYGFTEWQWPLKQGLSLQKRLWWHRRPPLSLFFTSLASTNQRFPLQIKLNEMFIRHTHKLQLLGNTIGFYDNKVDIFCEHHNSPEKKNTQNNITDWSSAQFEYIVCESSAVVCVCMYVSVIVIRFW